VVLSPHLDDAAFSLGAAIHRARREGNEVVVVTVLGCDPDSGAPAGYWDRRSRFRTEGEAAATRRTEDDEALSILGATAVRFPYGDTQYERHGTDDEIWASVEPHLTGADSVLVPAYPLIHPDHAWLASLALQRLRGSAAPVALYGEQPYLVIRKWWEVWKRPLEIGPSPVLESFLGEQPEWTSIPVEQVDRDAKLRACRAYATQLPLMSRAPILPRMFRYEAARGGEALARLSRTKARS
jgi:LmbE family N-acetylglucosaminyl deacetylase